MHILQICSPQTLGGGEVHVIQLVAELKSRGHRVEVAGRSGGPIAADHTLRFRNALDVGSILGLRRLAAAGGFDIVHAHVARDYPIAAAALLGQAGPRLVLTRQLIHRVRWTPLYRRVDGWIATTEQIAGTLGRLAPRRTAVIPNWVDCRRFPYSDRALREPVAIGLLGQISPHKGHDDAIAMIRQLETGFRLLIAGQGDESYLSHLREAAAGLPVTFAGFVEAASFLETVDILILPSWEEPFGIVVLEAMASGVNVVATDAGGPPVILAGGEAGLLVPPGNPGRLAEAVRSLAADHGLAHRLRQRARERAETVYDIRAAVEQTEDFYRELIERP